MRIFLWVLAATVFESLGDALVRMALHHASLPVRLGLFAAGFALLALYGTSLNLAPTEFAAVTGMYVATLFIIFQITNFALFRTAPSMPTLVGGSFIVVGGLIVSLWR